MVDNSLAKNTFATLSGSNIRVVLTATTPMKNENYDVNDLNPFFYPYPPNFPLSKYPQEHKLSRTQVGGGVHNVRGLWGSIRTTALP